MTVKFRHGAKFRGGWTWFESVPFGQVREYMPCYECYWDDDGKVTRTERYALLPRGEAGKLQQQADEPSTLSDDDSRLISYEEYHERWKSLNAQKWNGSIPDRFLNGDL